MTETRLFKSLITRSNAENYWQLSDQTGSEKYKIIKGIIGGLPTLFVTITR
jgi:hypothetical protein